MDAYYLNFSKHHKTRSEEFSQLHDIFDHICSSSISLSLTEPAILDRMSCWLPTLIGSLWHLSDSIWLWRCLCYGKCTSMTDVYCGVFFVSPSFLNFFLSSFSRWSTSCQDVFNHVNFKNSASSGRARKSEMWSLRIEVVAQEPHSTHRRETFCSVSCKILFFWLNFVLTRLDFDFSIFYRSYQCDVCDKWFPRRKTMTDHRKLHELIATNSKRPEIKCVTCGHTTKTTKAMNAHHRAKHGRSEDRRHQCNFKGCDKAYDSLKDMRAHVRSSHGLTEAEVAEMYPARNAVSSKRLPVLHESTNNAKQPRLASQSEPLEEQEIIETHVEEQEAKLYIFNFITFTYL